MRKSRRAMRRVVLTRLITHLKTQYGIEVPEELSSSDDISGIGLDAFLSFKSDFTMEELCAALARLESGTYGFCLRCKEPLSQTALDDDPAARLCSDCTTEFSHHQFIDMEGIWKSPQSPAK